MGKINRIVELEQEVIRLEQEVIRLKDLNREMVEALQAVTDYYYEDYTLPKPVVLHVRKVLRKARGEGE